MTAVSGPLIRAPILTPQRANYAAQALPAAEGRRARRLRRKVDLTSRGRWEQTQTLLRRKALWVGKPDIWPHEEVATSG